LGHAPSYKSKYATRSLQSHLPIVSKQGNAFLTSNTIAGERFHYFDTGIKRLIIELELENLCIFLVHLSLKYRHRHYQLSHLYELVESTHKPIIVAGDFNTLWGDYEIGLFTKATGLKSANGEGLPSYPSWAPRKQLDFILHSAEIRVTHFEIPRIDLSDHLPLICDFVVEPSASPSE
jgi:endonuclease/exonuclease/phosphatase family metal-dependent hydrolase